MAAWLQDLQWRTGTLPDFVVTAACLTSASSGPAQILKLDLPSEAVECAVRTYCYSAGEQQWERATVLFEGLVQSGVRPAESTVLAIFEALTAGRQGQKAHSLLMVW